MKKIQTNINLLIGSAFGLGLSPVAPGTFGALLGVLLHVLTVVFLPNNLHVFVLTFVLILIIITNHLLTPWAQEYWKSGDPGHFVLDEVAGYLVVPILFHQGEIWQIALWGFLLFRILDIIKIPPARQIDRHMKNSWGIVLDDIISGGYAVLLMYFLLWIGQKFHLEHILFTVN
ncbi:phosphatidylglycerophosphatase A [candidate division KSB1 bacterium]|nr:phosphatidylglycerophosphatase A [candidate division KSB1 bacterium]